MGIPLDNKTVLSVEGADGGGVELVLSGPGIYLAIKIKPTQTAAIIALLRAELPGAIKDAESQRRCNLFNRVDASTQKILTADKEYMESIRS